VSSSKESPGKAGDDGRGEEGSSWAASGFDDRSWVVGTAAVGGPPMQGDGGEIGVD
jgi:hypothetical protein